MEITMQIFREDFETVLTPQENISITKVYELINIAKKMNLLFLSSIDVSGITVFNDPQRKVLKKEILEVRSNKSTDQDILNILESAIDFCEPHYHVYIVLIGNV